MSRQFTVLPHRAVLALSGADRADFLQGLVSADIPKATPHQALWGALLTPQGHFLYDFCLAVIPAAFDADSSAAAKKGDGGAGSGSGDGGGSGALRDEAFWLDCEAERRDAFRKRLARYKLRNKVALEAPDPDPAVTVAWGEGAAEALGLSSTPGAATPFAGGVAFVDPRLPALGVRVLANGDAARAALTDAGFVECDTAAWDAERIRLGVPDGSRDMTPEKALLLENGFDELGGVSWDKGCYMGQELTARTKYRALIKRRLVPVTFDGPPPAPETPVLAGDKQMGEVKSGVDGAALALLRLEALDGSHALTADGSTVTPHVPDWLRLPEKRG